MEKKLYRSKQHKVVGGICGGLAEYFNIDPVLVRVIFIVACFGWGASLLAYIILWIIVPVNPVYETPFSSTENIESEPTVEKVEFEHKKTNGKIIFGAILIVIGLIALLNNIIPGIEFKYIYPLILIAFGIALILKHPHTFKTDKTEVL